MSKKVSFHYDSENKSVLMSFKHNRVIRNDGESEVMGANLDVLDYEGFVPEVAKECLEEMLALVNAAIAN